MASAPLFWRMPVHTMTTNPANEHLKQYITERLPDLVPGLIEGIEDQPSFTVDQQYRPLLDPVYRA